MFGVVSYQLFLEVPYLEVLSKGVNAPVCHEFLSEDTADENERCRPDDPGLKDCLKYFSLSMMNCDVKLRNLRSLDKTPVRLTKADWFMSMWGTMYVNMSSLLAKVHPLEDARFR